VHELANIEGLTDMPRLLSLLPARVGSLLNMRELSRSSGIPTAFLFQPLPSDAPAKCVLADSRKISRKALYLLRYTRLPNSQFWILFHGGNNA